jgi:hypothetical protein
MYRKIVSDIIAALFTLLFVYTALSKLLDFNKFSTQLGQSPILTSFAGSIAWLIPSIEIIVGIILSIPKLRLLGFYFSLTLMAMFTSYIIVILKFSYNIPCTCGGVISKMSWNQHLFFNLLFLTLAAIGIIIQNKQEEQLAPIS